MGNLSGWQGNFIPNVEFTIAQGATESAAVNTKGLALAGILLPSVFTGTALTFMVGDSEDGFAAKGQAVFSGVCSDGDTIEINGVEITFVAASPGANEVLIGATAAETVENLQAFLDDTDDADLLECSYESEGAVLMVTAVEHGTAGNAFTFDKSSSDITLTPSGGTLAGGGFRPLYNSANSLVSMTVAQGRAYAVDPALFQGVFWLKLKSGTTEVAQRSVICSLKGF